MPVEPVLFGEHDQGTIDQIVNCAAPEDCVAAAVMADGHLGYSMPVGGVAVYTEHISPSGVGYDIACGNMAVRTNIKHDEIADNLPEYMLRIEDEIAFGLGRNRQDQEESLDDLPVFDNVAWTLNPNVNKLKRGAEAQLGTVGAGNHYVDLLTDDDGFVWIANHFGSRGLGHKIATGYLKLAHNKRWEDKPVRDDMSAPPTLIPLYSHLGQEYMEMMGLAGEYAYAGREYVINQVLNILDNPEVTFSVHLHHNYAWYEDTPFGKAWVVSKGATPLHAGDIGFIGASMGGPSAIVRSNETNISAINSAPHGAGRAMSRNKAAGKLVKVPGSKRKVRSGGLITHEMKDDATSGVVVRGGGTDEAPQAYKKLDEVLNYHPNLEVLYWLRPVGVVMAPENTLDPFAD